MSNKTQTRWLNEYLDGEIGLADKAELERQMAANPDLREEYSELRRIGLLMGTMPEVQVHPYRFRQKLQETLDQRSSVYFTPQRAFAASMAFSLVIICITFGLFFYYQTMASGITAPAIDSSSSVAVNPVTSQLTIDTGVTAESYFNRLATECGIGLADQGLMSVMLSQTAVFEGATCLTSSGLESTRFPAPLPLSVRISVLPHQARDLASVAEGLSGSSVRISSGVGSQTIAEVLQQYRPQQQLTLCLKFQQSN